MPVSNVGSSGVNYPANLPPNGPSAFSVVMLSRLSDMAGSLAEASKAFSSLAQVHTSLSESPPDTATAITAANNFMELVKAQGHSVDRHTAALYTQATNYFAIDSRGIVTGFQQEADGSQFSDWFGSIQS